MRDVSLPNVGIRRTLPGLKRLHRCRVVRDRNDVRGHPMGAVNSNAREREAGGGAGGVCAAPSEAQLSPSVVIARTGRPSTASASRSANESRNLYFYVESPIFKC